MSGAGTVQPATPTHYSAAWIDKCRPNLLITESTYATTIRDSKRCRERDFLKKVHETVERGGKVVAVCSGTEASPSQLCMPFGRLSHPDMCQGLGVVVGFCLFNTVEKNPEEPSLGDSSSLASDLMKG